YLMYCQFVEGRHTVDGILGHRAGKRAAAGVAPDCHCNWSRTTRDDVVVGVEYLHCHRWAYYSSADSVRRLRHKRDVIRGTKHDKRCYYVARCSAGLASTATIPRG